MMLGSSLKLDCEYLGLTPGRLAQLIGVSQKTVATWESDHHTVPSKVKLVIWRLQSDRAKARAAILDAIRLYKEAGGAANHVAVPRYERLTELPDDLDLIDIASYNAALADLRNNGLRLEVIVFNLNDYRNWLAERSDVPFLRIFWASDVAARARQHHQFSQHDEQVDFDVSGLFSNSSSDNEVHEIDPKIVGRVHAALQLAQELLGGCRCDLDVLNWSLLQAVLDKLAVVIDADPSFHSDQRVGFALQAFYSRLQKCVSDVLSEHAYSPTMAQKQQLLSACIAIRDAEGTEAVERVFAAYLSGKAVN